MHNHIFFVCVFGGRLIATSLMLLALSSLQLAKYLYPEGLAFSHVRSINISDNAMGG